MVAFPRAVIIFCNLIHCFSTFSLTFPSSLLKLPSVSSERVNKSFERVGVSIERVTKSFEWVGVSSERVNTLFKRMQIFFERFTNGCKQNPAQKRKVVRVRFPCTVTFIYSFILKTQKKKYIKLKNKFYCILYIDLHSKIYCTAQTY